MVKLVEELVSMDLINEDDEVIFTDESKELIHIIATQCRETKIYKRTQSKGKSYSEDMTAEELYIDMLVKIVNAPTSVHALGSVKLLMPLIDDKLQKIN